jgi:urease accessory protein
MGPFAGATGFAGGLLHPLLMPAHLIALIGLALVAGRHPSWARAAIVAAFALGLAGGLGGIAWGLGETPAGDVLLVAAVACGALAAAGTMVSAWLAAPAALVCGAALGLDSPPESISLREAALMLVGTGCGGIAALAAFAMAAGALARLWQGVALRVAGSWIAAIAILVLARRWVS